MKKNIFNLFFLSFCFVAFCADGNALNRLLKLPLAPDGEIFNRITLEKQLQLFGIQLEGDSLRRSAFLRGKRILGGDAKEIIIISDANDTVTQIDIVFANKGDSSDEKNMDMKIRNSFRLVRDKLTLVLGKPKRTKYGVKGMKSNAIIWQNDNTTFVLEYIESEYTILHIIYRRDYNVRAKVEKLKRDDFLGNVVKKNNGDVYIDNIPMVNQGQKGYCATATMERILRYYGITKISQHQLANEADTGRGGGTPMDKLLSRSQDLLIEYGVEIFDLGEIRVGAITKYIDQGAPIMWWMRPNSKYSNFLEMSRVNREKASSLKEWLKYISDYEIPRNGDSHICLIVGYNKETDEIAVSNSWGDREQKPAWIPIKLAKKVSLGHMYAIRAKR